MNRKIFNFFFAFFLIFQSESQAVNPSDFVQSAVNRASEILKQNISKDEKMDKIELIAEEVVDIKGIAYYSLGSHRKSLSTEKKGEYFGLRVKGDSMIDAGIHDGDWVIIEEGSKAYKSKVHVILIDNQDVTLKYIEKINSGQIKLIPANKRFKEVIYPVERILIQGHVVGQVRIY